MCCVKKKWFIFNSTLQETFQCILEFTYILKLLLLSLVRVGESTWKLWLDNPGLEPGGNICKLSVSEVDLGQQSWISMPGCRKESFFFFLFPILKYKKWSGIRIYQQYLRHELQWLLLVLQPEAAPVEKKQLWLLQLAAVFCLSCWTTCDVFGTFTHPLCLFYLKMWQMMTMTPLIRTGFSGLSLRNTSSKEGGGGERAAGWKNGRFWVGTDMEESVPDAADSVKAV